MSIGESNFYGVTTVGSKGQIVIPAEAREEMGLQPGEKVIIFGRKNPQGGYGVLCVSPINAAEKLVETLTRHVTATQEALKQAKEEK